MAKFGNFTGWLMLRYENGRVWYVINDSKSYRISAPIPDENFGYQLADGRRIIIPDNFQTDFATIPSVFWRIAPPVGRGARAAYGKAAVIHDYLYKKKEISYSPCSRREADDIFYECMLMSEVSLYRRWIMWFAVRLFGWMPWWK